MKGITTLPELNHERWYTTAQAVAILEMDRVTFWRLCRDGEIPYKRQPGNFRKLFKGKELVNFWRRHLMPI